jgi:hypothetical protein
MRIQSFTIQAMMEYKKHIWQTCQRYTIIWHKEKPNLLTYPIKEMVYAMAANNVQDPEDFPDRTIIALSINSPINSLGNPETSCRKDYWNCYCGKPTSAITRCST